MTHRERILKRIAQEPVDHAPFFPDLSYYFQVRTVKGDMPEEYGDARDVLDMHRLIDAGILVHVYGDYYRKTYRTVEYKAEIRGDEERRIYRTPKGELQEVRRKTSPFESPFVIEHYIKSIDDFEIMEYVLADEEVEPNYPALQKIIDWIGDLGIVDLVIPRSPLPRLLIDWMGVAEGIFALHDRPDRCKAFFEAVEEANRPVIEIAAAAPGEVCIFGDNIDNVTVSPGLFSAYSVPYYQRHCDTLHKGGKKVAAHMDGRLKGLLPLIKEASLDIVDGATPAPMNDYEPAELAAALGEDQVAWCGVPATLFCDRTSLDEVITLNDGIESALGERVILNVGDQVPPDADMGKIAALARHIAGR